MPIQCLSAAEAYDNLKSNAYNYWPRVDDTDNRFLHFAAPNFTSKFTLEPGQKIFTIGSCFARGIEVALEQRGFEIPTRKFEVDKSEWGGDPSAVLNNYVPQAIAPHIRWAFGLETFDINRHAVEVRPGRFIDMQMPHGFKPMPAEAVIARRNSLSQIYRTLADCSAVIITLGLIEAWFDKKAGTYVNCPPPKSSAKLEPDRFELHVLEYNQVLESLRDLIRLLDQVCMPGYKIILTVSPVPLISTFTKSDVSVANTYSKSVLRAATEAIIAEFHHVDYFPSFESVLLSERSRAFDDDQIHIAPGMVKFNVDRMVKRYVAGATAESSADIIARAMVSLREGQIRAAVSTLQAAHAASPDDVELTIALADFLIRAGSGKAGETLLLKLLETTPSNPARTLLAKYYNGATRYSEAALQAEKASEGVRPTLVTSIQRAIAYYHLGRYEEGLALLEILKAANNHRPVVIFWKARYAVKLGRLEDAESWFRQATTMMNNAEFHTTFAEFLASQGKWDEVGRLVDEVLMNSPLNPAALKLRAELRARAGDVSLTREQVAGRRGASPFRIMGEAARAVVTRYKAKFTTIG